MDLGTIATTLVAVSIGLYASVGALCVTIIMIGILRHMGGNNKS